MTVFVYVNSSKQVGDRYHSRSSRMPTPRKPGLRKTDPKAWPLSTGFWNKRGRQLRLHSFLSDGSIEANRQLYLPNLLNQAVSLLSLGQRC